MKGPVRDITGRAGWPEKFGRRIAHFSIESALGAIGAWPPQGGQVTSPVHEVTP
jgi:hypothetical protein